MNNIKTIKILNLSLFAGICIWAILSLTTMLTLNYIVKWQHYLAFVFLFITGFMFIKNHQIGTLFLCLTLLLALVGIISFNVGLVGFSFYWTPFDVKIMLFWGNPIILILLILHFIIAHKYYFGIATKKYWIKLLKNQDLK